MMRSNLTNPEFQLSDLGYAFSMGENSALLSILGNKTSQTCPKKFADYLFGKEESSPGHILSTSQQLVDADGLTWGAYTIVNERLPYAVGWKKSEIPITKEDLVNTIHDIEKKTAYPPPPPKDNTKDIFNQNSKRWNLHAGYF
jgi:hypothetical protein